MHRWQQWLVDRFGVQAAVNERALAVALAAARIEGARSPCTFIGHVYTGAGFIADSAECRRCGRRYRAPWSADAVDPHVVDPGTLTPRDA